MRSKRSGRYGSTTAPWRRWALASNRARAVDEVRDHVDPDGRATETGLDDVRARECAGGSGPSVRAAAHGEAGSPAPATTTRRPACPSPRRHRPPSGPISGPRRGRARPAGCRPLRAAVTAFTTALDREGPGPTEASAGAGTNPPSGAGDELQRLVAPRGIPSKNDSASSEASTWYQSPVLDQYSARIDVDAGRGQAACRLQAGQDAHIVFRRRTSEDDGDVGHGGLTPPIGGWAGRMPRRPGATGVPAFKGSGPADRSRTARHRRCRGGSGPTPSPGTIGHHHDRARPIRRPTPPPPQRPAIGPTHHHQVGGHRGGGRRTRVLLDWRGPSSTIPGVTTADRGAVPGRRATASAATRTGRVGVVGVVEHDGTAGSDRLLNRWATAGSVAGVPRSRPRPPRHQGHGDGGGQVARAGRPGGPQRQRPASTRGRRRTP